MTLVVQTSRSTPLQPPAKSMKPRSLTGASKQVQNTSVCFRQDPDSRILNLGPSTTKGYFPGSHERDLCSLNPEP